MWICFNDAFVSAVHNRNDPDRLCVRARRRKHLERLFPDADIIMTPDADYGCRVFTSKTAFAEVVTKRVREIRYDNFKDSVKEAPLHDLYEIFWHLHYRYQREFRSR